MGGGAQKIIGGGAFAPPPGAATVNECKPEFQFKKSSKNAKFGQSLYLVAHLCYEHNRCAERTVARL